MCVYRCVHLVVLCCVGLDWCDEGLECVVVLVPSRTAPYDSADLLANHHHPTLTTAIQSSNCSIYSRDPETQTSSHLTMITFCPANNSFATTEARRPRRWSRPSIITVVSNMMIDWCVWLTVLVLLGRVVSFVAHSCWRLTRGWVGEMRDFSTFYEGFCVGICR